MTLKDLKNALANVEAHFTTQVFIQPRDVLTPLMTKAKTRMGRTSTQIFDRFKGSDELIQLEEFASMVDFFLGFKMTQDEQELMFSYCANLTGAAGAGINKNHFE